MKAHPFFARHGIAILVPFVAFLSTALAQMEFPKIGDDRRVTFQLAAPEARSVIVTGIQGKEPTSLSKNEDGLWEVTVGPLEPEIYNYHFEVDGMRVIDPQNRWVKKWFTLDSLFEIPGDPPLLHESQAVPHGTVHHHLYDSSTTGNQRPVSVYTPPGFTPGKELPILFLLHGFGDDERAWEEVGRVSTIVDNLIARKAISPLTIVMPYGHPVPVSQRGDFDDYAPKNHEAMEKDLLTDLIPFIKSHYPFPDDRTQRAIAGLSMGGGHSLEIGIKNREEFAWIGGFSSAAPENNLEERLIFSHDDVERFNEHIELLWIGCGKGDFLLERNQAFVEWLKSQDIEYEYELTEGGHSWDVWRKYLAMFLQKIFVTKNGDSETE